MIFGILLFAGVLFAVYELGQKQIPLESGQRQPLPTSTLAPTLIPDPSADWKTYRNTKHGYLIKHPSNFILKDLTTDAGHQIEILGDDFDLIMRVREWGELVNYLDREPSGEVDVGEMKAKVYKFPTGYCDTTCTQPFVAVVVYKEDRRFVFEFYGESELTETATLILSTFRFLDSIDAGQDSVEEKFCGGIAANLPENQCPPGYRCQLEGDYPDAGGRCVRE